jgi:uncharacterized protein
MKVMVDTNVILSAIIKPGSTPSEVLMYVSEKEELFLCPSILKECLEVSARRFPSKREVLSTLFENLRFNLAPESPHQGVDIGDIKDQPILNSAIANGMDILVTGDHHFLELNSKKPVILTPTGYFSRYMKV